MFFYKKKSVSYFLSLEMSLQIFLLLHALFPQAFSKYIDTPRKHAQQPVPCNFQARDSSSDRTEAGSLQRKLYSLAKT